MNFFAGRLRDRDDSTHFESPYFSLVLPGPPLRESTRDVMLGVRPHDIKLVAPEHAHANARVDAIQPLGSQKLLQLHLTCKDEKLQATALVSLQMPLAPNDRVGILFSVDHLHLFDSTDGRRLN
jgi:ABC-type sugar transport system ATPase subunit